MEGICRDYLASFPYLFRGGRVQRARCPRKTAGCESNYGGILKARWCGSKELLLIGRCPKYNKTASPLCFTSQSRVNHELITHPSAPYIYMYISRDFNNTPYTLHRSYRSYRPPHYSVLTTHYLIKIFICVYGWRLRI